MKKCFGLLLLSFVLISCAKSPTNTTTTTGSNADDPPSINSVDVVKAQPHEATLAPGESGETVVLVKIANGYHVNANPPSQQFL